MISVMMSFHTVRLLCVHQDAYSTTTVAFAILFTYNYLRPHFKDPPIIINMIVTKTDAINLPTMPVGGVYQ